jgi:hypothetical protein
MTDGTWQVRDGHLVIDDAAALAVRGGAVVAQLWEQLDAERMFVPQPRSELVNAR